MSGQKKKSETSHGKSKAKTYDLTGSWAGAWKMFAGVGALGLAASVIGAFSDPKRFAFSWLFAFVTVLCVALGAIFFVLYQRLTSAGWSVTVRRTAEFFATGVLVFIPAVLPIIWSMGELFPWVAPHAEQHEEHHGAVSSFVRAAHAQEHAAPSEHAPAEHAAAAAHGAPTERGAGHDEAAHTGGHGHAAHEGKRGPGLPDPHVLIEEEVLAKKSAYLNRSFFILRAFLYVAIWAYLAFTLFRFSTEQDKAKKAELTLQAQRFAAPATVVFAITLTFAGVDWIMSLEPGWFSTIFGVNIFACAVVSSHAVIILTTMALRNNGGPLKDAVTVEHYHDLGKLLFGFLVFWAYISFSQYMLIWYAALPEETTWYHHRWAVEPWATVSMMVIIGHFVIPFFWLISRWFKRNLGRLQLGAIWLLAMHAIDMYWFVMPNYLQGKEGFSIHWLDLTCLLAIGGFYGAFVFFRMTKFPLVPIGDPRLQRSLHFQNA